MKMPAELICRAASLLGLRVALLLFPPYTAFSLWAPFSAASPSSYKAVRPTGLGLPPSDLIQP